MIHAAPAYLWALPVVAIPLAIYLIFRRRRRDVPWGAIYILRQVLETRSRTAAWIQYCVIALRTLACLALVLLFAAPSLPWQARGDFPASAPSTHRLIILDTSESMQAGYAGGLALDAALAQVRAILRSSRSPGRVDLLVGDGATILGTFDRLPVAESSLEVVLAHGGERRDPFDLPAALRQAEAIFLASPYTHRELYLLGDFCAGDLSPSALADVAPRLARLREADVAIHALALREPLTANFALYECAPLEPVLLANQPAPFRARIGYYGTAATGQTVLTVKDSQGRMLHEQTITLGVGVEEIVFPVSLPPGEHRIDAFLRPDALAADNQVSRQFHVLSQLDLILVQRLDGAQGFENPRTWLEFALRNLEAENKDGGARFASTADAYAAHSRQVAKVAQHGAADAAVHPFTIAVEGKIAEQLNDELLRTSHLVIALDLDELTAEALAVLRRHVARGGTVLLAPGATVQPERFNQTFAALSPALIDPPRHETVDPRRYEQCLVEAGEAIFLRELEEPSQGNLGAPRFYRWFHVAPEMLADDAAILLGLSDGSPLLLERPIGRGQVLLWTAGLGGDWNSMVVHPAYPVWLIRTLQRAAARRAFPRTLQAGQPILLLTDAPQARVLGPGGIDQVVESVVAGDRRFIRYDETAAAGSYDVRVDLASEQPGERFEIVDPHPEADLRPLAAEVAEAFAAATGAPIHGDVTELTAAVGNMTSGVPLAPWFGVLLLVALLLEAGLSRLLSA